MATPFEGFVVPPLPYVAGLLAATVIIVAILYAMGTPVTQMTVLALAPWMVNGATLHVFYQLGERFQARVYPPLVEPLFSAPAVYLTTFVGTGSIWVLASLVGQTVSSETEERDDVARYLGLTGVGVMVLLAGLLAWQGLDPAVGPLQPVLPTLGLLVAMVLAFVVYVLLGTWRTYVVAEARHVGALVLFAHLLDGVTTTIGVDLLGTGERSVLPARIIEFAAGLPTAPYLGSGWLFVVVKLAIAVLIVVVFADYVREEPTRGNLLFAIVTAVGLGPAMNNYFLFVLGLT